MPSGTVKWFNDAKGYGFLSRADGREVFAQGQRVDYDEHEGPQGLFALRVVAAG